VARGGVEGVVGRLVPQVTAQLPQVVNQLQTAIGTRDLYQGAVGTACAGHCCCQLRQAVPGECRSSAGSCRHRCCQHGGGGGNGQPNRLHHCCCRGIQCGLLAGAGRLRAQLPRRARPPMLCNRLQLRPWRSPASHRADGEGRRRHGVPDTCSAVPWGAMVLLCLSNLSNNVHQSCTGRGSPAIEEDRGPQVTGAGLPLYVAGARARAGACSRGMAERKGPTGVDGASCSTGGGGTGGLCALFCAVSGGCAAATITEERPR
jgi:hypothetical protein